MDKRNRRTQIRHVFEWNSFFSDCIFGVPLISAIEVESPLAIASLLVLIVGSYSTLYLR